MYAILMVLFRPDFTLIFPSDSINTTETLQVVEKYKYEILIIFPKILVNLLDENKKQKRDLSNLMAIGIGGQQVSASLIERIKNETSVGAVSVGYGSTEATAISGQLIRVREFSKNSYLSCVGQPYPFVECKIVNSENQQIQPLGVEGELHVRGFGVTCGYFNDPEVTRKCIDINNWYTSKIITLI